jgi:hypothetical protein
VESTPTYKRTREVLEGIRSRANGDDMITKEEDEEKEPIDLDNGKIKFID